MSVYFGNNKIGELAIGTLNATSSSIQLATPTIESNTTTGRVTATVRQLISGYLSASSTSNYIDLTTQGGTTATPSGSEQTIVSSGTYVLGPIKVAAISSTFVGSGITRNPTITINGRTVTIPEGYYSSDNTKSVSLGTAGTPIATKGSVTNHQLSITPSVENSTGWITGGTISGTAITVSASELVSGTLQLSANGNVDVTNYKYVNVAVPTGSTIVNENRTIIPNETVQTITADSTQGYTGLGIVTVEAIPSNYVNITNITKTSSDLTVNGRTVTAPAGYYAAAASASVATGTAGTPTATKGTVSNNSVSITPSVTNTTGYITGDTRTGTVVTVTASELVSGTLSITSNGTKDVTNYASVNVNVPTGGGGITPTGTYTITANGTYDVTNYASADVTFPDLTFPTTLANSATSGYTNIANFTLTAGSKYLNIPTGNNTTTSYYKLTVASGSATTPATSITATPTLSINSSTGVVTATVSATKSITPTVSAGYVSNGTAGTVTASGSDTLVLTTKAAATITPTTSNQTIAAGTYLTGAQTIKGDANLSSGNIKSGITIFGVSGTYAGASVSTQTKTADPSESAVEVTPDSGYVLSKVTITAIPSDYVGSGVARKTSSNLTVSGATVTAPAGYYASNASASVSSGSATTPATIITANPTIGTTVSSGKYTISVSKTQSVTPTVSAGYVSSGTAGTITVSGSTTVDQSVITNNTTLPSGSTSSGTINAGSYIKIAAGYYPSDRYYMSAAQTAGNVTAPSSISGTSATVTTGTNTLTLTKTISVTPNVTTAGYISSGTAGNSNVSLTASVTTKAAATYRASTSAQTIAAGTYLTGAQTIAAVSQTNLSAANIKAGTTISISNGSSNIWSVTGTFTNDATATAADINAGETAYVNGSKVTGTQTFSTIHTGTSAPTSSLGANGDVYLVLV